MDKQEQLNIEGRAIDTLLNNGISFEMPRKGLLKYILGKTKKYIIRQPYLGTLDYITKEYLSMNVDEKVLKSATIEESWQLTANHTQAMARIIAIAILNSKWRIKFLTGYLSRKLMWELNPSKLRSISVLIAAISNTADFTNSIRLMSGMRTTAPKADLIEQKQEG